MHEAAWTCLNVCTLGISFRLQAHQRGLLGTDTLYTAPKNTPLVIPGSLQLLQVFGQSGFVHLDLPLTRCNIDIKYLRPTESPKRCKCQCKSPCKGLVSEGNLPFQHCRQKLPAAQALHLSFSKVLCEDCVFAILMKCSPPHWWLDIDQVRILLEALFCSPRAWIKSLFRNKELLSQLSGVGSIKLGC